MELSLCGGWILSDDCPSLLSLLIPASLPPCLLLLLLFFILYMSTSFLLSLLTFCLAARITNLIQDQRRNIIDPPENTAEQNSMHQFSKNFMCIYWQWVMAEAWHTLPDNSAHFWPESLFPIKVLLDHLMVLKIILPDFFFFPVVWGVFKGDFILPDLLELPRFEIGYKGCNPSLGETAEESRAHALWTVT